MAGYADEPRYTIEQIDLLQRLRRSGMSTQQIVQAMDTMERLDREHGEKFGRRGAAAAEPAGNFGAAPSSSSHFAPVSGAAQTRDIKTQYGSPTSSQGHMYEPSPPPCNPSTTNHAARDTPGAQPHDRPANGFASPRYSGGTGGGGSGTQYGLGPLRLCSFEASEEDLELEERVEDLTRRDSGTVKEEIKAFLACRRISQAIVGQVTGISQSYISQWLLQHGLDMSDGKKRAFYRWYLLEKHNPGATLSMRPAPSPQQQQQQQQQQQYQQQDEMVDWRMGTPAALRVRRGSRFTWRKECLTVMESYFSENQYPDEAKREEIANACNAVIQKPGKKLSELERVTPLKVYNWFANRRKEIKRRANIEAAILESHGLEVQSPGAHSISDDVEGPEYSEQDESQSEHQPDPISLAVEMAAVNHSILALSNQGGGGGGGGGGGSVKMEAPEFE